MAEDSLSIALGNSLQENVANTVGELAEVGLDCVLEDGVLRDIPIVSSAISLYKIGSSIKERHNIKKLIAFLNAINKGIVDEEKRIEYQKKFQSNEKFRNQEIEYILVLIDRYISMDKPEMLAKLYLAYLDGTIIWEEFTMYAEVIDRFLLLDASMLTSDTGMYRTFHNIGAESILRLVALGLVGEITQHDMFQNNVYGDPAEKSTLYFRSRMDEREYIRTEFGEKLADILREKQTSCEVEGII